MAEVQKAGQTMGEMSQRFVEFVMMHAQNAALFLGQIPNPRTGQPEVNLELAKMFIDQLDMIQEKTRGNLTSEEGTVLRNALSNLQMAYVEVSGGKAGDKGQTSEPAESAAHSSAPSEPAAPASEASAPPQQPPIASSEGDAESKKKFTKSYGP